MDALLSLLIANKQLLISAGLGTALGFEREIAGKDPSLRTFALISMGSCIFGMLSLDAAVGSNFSDPGRIAAQVVTGVGFLGAGAIFRSKPDKDSGGLGYLSGMTTAALIWVAAGIGLLVGFNQVSTAIVATFIALATTLILRIVHQLMRMIRPEAKR